MVTVAFVALEKMHFFDLRTLYQTFGIVCGGEAYHTQNIIIVMSSEI